MKFAKVWMAACVIVVTAQAAAQTIVVDTQHVLRTDSDRVVGINLNYIRDHDKNRESGARTLEAALKEMSPGCLRYPGGNKSNYHFWSRKFWTSPKPQAIWYGNMSNNLLDFDDYSKLVKAVGAQPYIVVACPSVEWSAKEKEKHIQNASTWVAYAKKNNYQVKYWEIGNENWNDCEISIEEVAARVIEFSKAMKLVDPTIKVGASGDTWDWRSKFIPEAAPHIDFVSMSTYNTWNWKSYDHYYTQKLDLVGGVGVAKRVIHRLPPEHRDRIEIVVAEMNSQDFSTDGWTPTNTIGHALVTFHTFGELLEDKKVPMAMLWTTRYLKEEQGSKSLFWGLGTKNEITPSGRAVAIWGNFVQDTMVSVTSDVTTIKVFASKSSKTNDLNVFIINKSPESVAKPFNLKIDSPVNYTHNQVYRFSGKDPNDLDPKWGEVVKATIKNNRVSGVSLPGVSITIISLNTGQ